MRGRSGRRRTTLQQRALPGPAAPLRDSPTPTHPALIVRTSLRPDHRSAAVAKGSRRAHAVLADLRNVDLPARHWPISRRALAAVIGDCARQAAAG